MTREAVAPSATAEEDTSLAEQRADAVRKYLVRKGVPEEILRIEGVVAAVGGASTVEFLVSATP